MQLRREYPDHRINVLPQDANIALPWFCDHLRTSDRAVVFLDPFATEVSWATVEALAHTQKIDCWILFPVGAIARLMPISGLPSPRLAEQLDRIFGGNQHWRDFYQVRLSLLDHEPRQERQHGSHQIASRYRDRLTSTFHTVAPTPRIFRNSNRSPMFELFFAASNPVGAPIAIRIADYLLRNW